MILIKTNQLLKGIILGAFLCFSCNNKVDKILPDVITEQTLNDTDDPAIWINKEDTSQSIVFGTDKESNGAIYAFTLEGKILHDKTIKNVRRPNNIDLAYGLKLNDSSKVDFIAFTERERNQIRFFSVPNMKPIDNDGVPVFVDEQNPEFKLPMGIALYKSKITNEFYAIVGRKSGPKEGYLYQYQLKVENSLIKPVLIRKFGKFSGKKEIEAIAVDAENGFIYYADEMHGVRKYHAEPNMGNDEVSCFGGDQFLRDIEGIAIAKTDTENGLIIISDQQRGTFNLFDRKTNSFIKSVNLSTYQTDGCEVVTTPLNSKFNSGLFVAMNDNKNFYFYDLKKVFD